MTEFFVTILRDFCVFFDNSRNSSFMVTAGRAIVALQQILMGRQDLGTRHCGRPHRFFWVLLGQKSGS